jgi:hypothetical protein
MFSDAAFSQVPYSTLAELGEITGNIFETAFAQDQYSARLLSSNCFVSETGVVSEVVATIGAFRLFHGEGASATATPSTLADSAIFIGELARTADLTVSKLFGLSARSEDAVALDVSQARLTLPSAVDETVTGDDTFQAAPTFPTAVVEAVSGTDAQSSVFNVRSLVFEMAVAQSSQVLAAAFAVSRAELVQAQVRANGRMNFIVRFQDGATIFDRASGRGLWEPVPDAQDPNWVIIPTNPTQ